MAASLASRELSPPRPGGQRARPGGGAARRRGLARCALGRPGDAGPRGRRHPDPARRRPDPVARAGRRVVRRPPRAARRARRAYLVRAARRRRRRAGGPGRLGRPARAATAARRRRHERRRPLRGAARLPRHGMAKWRFATRHCPRCGGSLESRLAGAELVCVDCGKARFRTGPGGDHGDHARRAGLRRRGAAARTSVVVAGGPVLDPRGLPRARRDPRGRCPP